MDVEKVIRKLEEVYKASCDQYLNLVAKTRSPQTDLLHEIKELGDMLIRSKHSINEDIQKAEQFIERKVNIALSKAKKGTAESIAKEIEKRLSILVQ